MTARTIWMLTLLPAAALVVFAGLVHTGQLLPTPTLAGSAITPIPSPADGQPAVVMSRDVVGDAARGDVDAAVKALTVTDDGIAGDALRWEQDTVHVRIDGASATSERIDAIDRVLAWLQQATGVTFTRTGDGQAEVVVTLEAGRQPRSLLHRDGHALRRVEVQWDPTHPHAGRWMWEELLHAAGPYGDWGPDGAIIAADQDAARPSDFDRWLLEGLYAADTLDDADLRAGLTATLPAGR